jgi:hypothetical protein
MAVQLAMTTFYYHCIIIHGLSLGTKQAEGYDFAVINVLQ